MRSTSASADSTSTVRGEWPSRPRRTALGVPWPWPVAPSEPNSSARTVTVWASRPSFLRRPTNIRAARIGPTVWELEGPMPMEKRSKTEMATGADSLVCSWWTVEQWCERYVSAPLVERNAAPARCCRTETVGFPSPGVTVGVVVHTRSPGRRAAHGSRPARGGPPGPDPPDRARPGTCRPVEGRLPCAAPAMHAEESRERAARVRKRGGKRAYRPRARGDPPRAHRSCTLRPPVTGGQRAQCMRRVTGTGTAGTSRRAR